MSNVQIPNLPVAIALNGTEALEAVQSGTSVQTTVSKIAQYANSYYPGFFISNLPAAASVNSTDIFPVVQGSTGPNTGTTYKATVAQLFTSPTFTGLTNSAKLAVGAFATSLNGTFQASGNVFGNSSTALPQFKSSFSLAGGYTGAGTNGIHLHELLLTTGNYGVGTAGTLINTYIGSTLGGSLATGNQVALQAEIDQTSATPNFGEYIIAGVLQATANSNAGGTAGTTNGSVFGTNVIAQLKTGATYFNSVIGAEIDIVAKQAVLDKIGLSLVPWVGDTTSGSRTDALLVFGRNVSSFVGMDYGAVFGSPLGWWPIKSTGTLIGAPYTENAGLPPGPAKQAAYGVDFSLVTFSSGAFKSNGFLVDGSGNTTTGSALDNYATISGASTGNAPTFAVNGLDTNVNAYILPKGNAALWAPRAVFATSAPAASPTNLLNRLSVSAPVVSVSSANSNMIRFGGNFYGSLASATSGVTGVNTSIVADTDSINAPKGFSLVYFGHNVSSASAVGGRTTHEIFLNVTNNVSAGSMEYYTARGAKTNISGSLGGVHFGPKGAAFGGNDRIELLAASGSLPGAGMNINQNVAYETNNASETGTQAYWQHGIQVVQLSNHVTRSVTSDAGIIFANQPLTAGSWRRGVSFGAINGKWPFSVSSQLIGSYPVSPSIVSDAYVAADGIDLSYISFVRNAFMTAGASLDGYDNFGAQVTAGVSLQTRDGIVAKTAVVNTITVIDPGLWNIGSTPTLTIDAPGGGGTTATATVASWTSGRVGRVDTAGANYVIGDLLTDTGGTSIVPAVLKVIKINATGGVTDLMPVAAYVTGSISGTTLTVTAATYGNLAAGMALDAPGVTNGTYIISGAHPTWTISRSQTVASTTICGLTENLTTGVYTVQSGAATTLSGGSGSSCTVTLLWGINTVTVAGAGTNYPQYPAPKCRASTSGEVRPASFLVTMTATQSTLVVNSGATTQTTALVNGLRVVTAAGAVTVAKTDYVVVVNKTVGAATTVNLPASPESGRTYVIKDGKGDAATNNITITPAAGTIDSAATLVINTNYGRITLVYNGTEWNRIG